jgi:hypothetical protein
MGNASYVSNLLSLCRKETQRQAQSEQEKEGKILANDIRADFL